LARKGKHEGEHENLERWLLTYADLITLLLAFFIVMYSMSKVDAKKFGAMAQALQSILHGKGTSMLNGEASLVGADKGGGPMKVGDMRLLQIKVNNAAREMGLEDKVSAEITERGLVIRISESAFFDPGKIDLKPEAVRFLDILSKPLIEIPNHVRIEGHTDNLPIRTERFPSNWELSVHRATVCVRYLIENHSFPPDRISALGYGEYRPIADNNTIEGRAKNRRVDIVVLTWENRLNEPEEKKTEFSTKEEEISDSIYGAPY
jgi:chemotaxis protein MotB